jgi:hypothetical protein
MAGCSIDHLVVTAPSLEVGAQFLRRTLGVAPQVGGKHPGMGTHNLLMRLGEALYLEVLSPDSGAPAPGRPRWFGLDRLRPDSPAALAAWVVRTADIRAAAAACPETLGSVEPMSRGDLRWQITITPDGSVPLGGAGPALIQWAAAPHPAAQLPDLGVSLAELQLFHPDPARVSRLLGALDLSGPVSVHPSTEGGRLLARIETPRGRCRLGAAVGN